MGRRRRRGFRLEKRRKRRQVPVIIPRAREASPWRAAGRGEPAANTWTALPDTLPAQSCGRAGRGARWEPRQEGRGGRALRLSLEWGVGEGGVARARVEWMWGEAGDEAGGGRGCVC